MKKPVFVFGSNLAGRHGKGAALEARREYGAIYGQGYGLQGNSFAIPTKDKNLKTLPLEDIKVFVDKFIKFAKENPDHIFFLTPIGTGLAGYKVSEIKPLFKNAPDNVKFYNTWNKK